MSDSEVEPDFVVICEHEHPLATIRITVDPSTLGGERLAALMQRLQQEQDALESKGFQVHCDPPLIPPSWSRIE